VWKESSPLVTNLANKRLNSFNLAALAHSSGSSLSKDLIRWDVSAEDDDFLLLDVVMVKR